MGAHIWDEDDTRYIDLCNGYGALLLGHGREEVVSSVISQLLKGTLVLYTYRIRDRTIKTNHWKFPSIDKVRLTNTGGEATMTAIRLARGFTKKKKIIKFEGCYHGAHDSVLVKAGSGSAHSGISVSEGIHEKYQKTRLLSSTTVLRTCKTRSKRTRTLQQ